MVSEKVASTRTLCCVYDTEAQRESSSWILFREKSIQIIRIINSSTAAEYVQYILYIQKVEYICIDTHTQSI